MIRGVDVSNWQGPPADWRPESGGIDFAGVKITELGTDGSRYVNPDAAADWAYLRDHGKGRIGYLFGHPGTSASGSAAFFLAELEARGLDDGDAVALDLEVSDGESTAHVASWSADVLALLERETGRSPLLYTFLSFAEAGNCAGLGKWPLWIADPSSAAGHPRVPHPWADWTLHQWRITGPIDRDVARYGDRAEFRAGLGKHKAKGAAVTEHVTAGKLSLAALAEQHGTAPSAILRLTAEHSHGSVYPANVAQWINGVFRGHVKAADPMPSGLHLFLKAKP